jgi:hypothetical protein
MKIWITRDSTGSIHSGGLERLRVWFTKPVFYFNNLTLEECETLPFGYPDGRDGFGRIGWRAEGHKTIISDLSFGKLFGYGSELENGHVPGLAEYVWSKLNEHYGNTKFPTEWYKYEKDGFCKIEDFLLEIDLSISFNANTGNA